MHATSLARADDIDEAVERRAQELEAEVRFPNYGDHQHRFVHEDSASMHV